MASEYRGHSGTVDARHYQTVTPTTPLAAQSRVTSQDGATSLNDVTPNSE